MLTKPISMSPDATVVHAEDGHILLTATFPTSCSLETFVDEEGVTRCYASLFMSDGQNSYRIFKDNGNEYYKEHFYPTYTKDNNSIKVTYDIDLTDETLIGACLGLSDNPVKGDYWSYYDGMNNTSTETYFRAIVNKQFNVCKLSKNSIFRWKIRVFEKNSLLQKDKYISNLKIGYGTVSSVKCADSESETSVSVSVFPHTNIYDWVLGDSPWNTKHPYNKADTDGLSNLEWYTLSMAYTIHANRTHYYSDKPVYVLNENRNRIQTVYNIINQIDDNIQNYITINGKQYPILKYRYRPFVYSTGNNIDAPGSTTDSRIYYGAGWLDSTATRRYKEELYDDYTWNLYENSIDYAVNPTKQYYSRNNWTMDQYSESAPFDSYGNPTCGYALIDTNGEIPCEEGATYTISCNYIDSDEGYFEIYSKPTVTLVEENAGYYFTDKNGEIYSGTTTNPYILTYCNIDIKAIFSQHEGVEHEYFYYKIYEYSDKGKYEIIHHSGNVYNSDIRVVYNDFLDSRQYKIVLSIVDTNQQTTERELYFKTEFPYWGDTSMIKAEYYRDHNSVVVEWSLDNSITPIVKNHSYEYVILGNETNDSAVVVDESNTIVYTQNDFGQKLNFENSTFALKFKLGTYVGNVAEVHTKDNYFKIYSERDEGSTCDNRIVVETRNKCCYGEIKRIASLDETIKALSTGESPKDRTLQWNDELVWDDSYIWVEGQNTNEDEYLVIVNSNDRVKIINLTLNEEFELFEKECVNSFISESKIELFGENTFIDLILINNSDISVMNNLKDESWTWTKDTQVMCSFNNTLNGANKVTSSNSKLVGVKVYKTIGDGIKLYKIADINNTDYTVIEDFVVGDNCKYQYHLFPIYQDVLNDKILYCNNPISSNEITLHQGVDKVFGLKEIEDNIYCVDLDNIWRIQLNLKDTGYTLNNTKTFFDTLHTYQQEYVGNMKYITKSISGLIGTVDCRSDSDEIKDNYDMLMSWNDFVTSATPKCLIDVRGIILPGNFEANPTVEYLQGSQSLASVEFNWRQKSDLDIISIYATVIPFNPVSGKIKYLKSKEPLSLVSGDDKVLLVSEGDAL